MVPIPILLYHRVNTSAGATPPSVFHSHMQLLHERGIRAISLDEFESVLAGQITGDHRSVLITFDDGSQDCLTQALPVLTEFNFYGTAFVISDHMGSICGGIRPRDGVLSWQEANQLMSSGRFALQSHSHTHVKWSFDNLGKNALADDLARALDTLEAGLKVPRSSFTHIAWPWGRCNPEWESLAYDFGFSHQYMVQKGAVTKAGRSLRLPRLCCDAMPTVTFARWISQLTTPWSARGVNLIFGTARKLRHGLAY